ncbi:ABC transporter permease [Desulfovibrio inopinatus]|uniref:ABC transporter permease n=1 Tax=Desulfovibrio inopinatus TaxID=102109 RepID=UPI0004235386|nr:FtsX-like permease family protein [Desulfovibrio inopinatus]
MAKPVRKRIFEAESTDVARQVVLPFQKSLEISIKSLKVRFFRSLITVASLVLAVAFLAFILVGANIVTGIAASGNPDFIRMLHDAGYDISSQAARLAGDIPLAATTSKERWIVFLSLLVCTVGIINAQLMAVTERFREIGTMKCLGALDSFVLRLFLLEAGMQGVVGSVAGAFIGLVFALLVALIRFGFTATSHVSTMAILMSLGLSIVIGAVLSLIGVFYPAVVAARMRPVEAMRTEG